MYTPGIVEEMRWMEAAVTKDPITLRDNGIRLQLQSLACDSVNFLGCNNLPEAMVN